MKRHHNNIRTLAYASLAWAAAASAIAGSATYNFDDGTTGDWQIAGDVSVRIGGGNPPVGGDASTNGFLSVTDARNGQRSAIVFGDFDDGLVVKAFRFSMDVRIGGGTENPADGFSINYMRSTDPVLNPNNVNGILDGWAGWGTETNLPEEGTQTGLGIGFDAWDSGSGDVVGISIRLDNQVIAQYPLPTRNGECTDVTSMQTGPRDPNGPGSEGLLCWQPFVVDLSEAGKLKVSFKGVEVTPAGGLQVNFVPSPGRLAFSARTGDANQNHHVDNISITTVPSTQPTVGSVTGGPSSFTFDILDAGATTVNASTIGVTVNGTKVTANGVKTGNTTVVSYNGFPTLFAVGSTNAIGVSFFDSNNNSNYVARSYTPSAYTIIPTAYAAGAGTVQATRGFKIRTSQTAADNQNNLSLTELQLAGLRGPNTIDTTTYPVGADGFFTQAFTTVNFNRDTAQAGSFGAEEMVPGFPGSYGDFYEHAAMELLTYLEFPAAGVYTMGVDSDDGFRITASKSAADKLGLVLGRYEGGRGADGTGTQFTFVIQQAGIYPVRLIWQNGGGGSNVEWYSLKADGSKVLVNDPVDSAAIKAYRDSTVPAPVPYIGLVVPANGQTGVRADATVRSDIVDGTSLTVNQGSIQMSINGAAKSPTITKSGSVTSVAFTPTSSTLLTAGTNIVTVVYADSATPTAGRYTNTWSFIVDPYTTIAGGTPIGTGDATKPGFRVKTWQQDPPGTQKALNLIAYAEQTLLGLWLPNVANLTEFTSNGAYPETGVVNYSIDSNQQGNFGGEKLPPGIPGTVTVSSSTENYVLELQTYVEFPTAGFYALSFNSDDGFRAYNTEGPGPIFGLKVNSPSSIAGHIGAVSAGIDEGGKAVSLSKTPLTAKVVYANPVDATTALVNAAEVAGNIVMIDRGVSTFQDKVLRAREAGAVGLILVNNRDETAAEGVLPFVIDIGDTNRNTIPVVMVTKAGGQKIKDHLNDAGGVNVSLGADPTVSLGDFNGGRGATDTTMNVAVPTAGVYPLRVITFQGGGGGNSEWFSVLPDGTKVLLNDTATTGHLKTYQARTVGATPTIGIAGTTVTFTGTLQSSDTVNGTFSDVVGATSPYTIPGGTTVKFYRTRN